MGFLERLRDRLRRRPGAKADQAPDPGPDAAPAAPSEAPEEGASSGAAGEREALLESLSFVDRGVVAIGRKNHAVNLTWVPQETAASLREKASLAEEQLMAEKGISLSLDLSVASASGTFTGFGSREIGHRRGMPALVEMIDDETLGSRWLAVLPVDGQEEAYWIGSKRDGGIFEDRLLMSRGSATELFMDYLSAPDWTAICAPEDWGVEDTRHGIPASAIRRKPAATLRHVFPLRVYGPRIAVAAVLLAASGGSLAYYLDQRAKHLAEMQAMRERIARAVQLTPADHPWHGRTTLPAFVSACLSAIDGALVAVPGWEIQPATCRVTRGQGTIDLGWRIAPGGNAAWLVAAMPDDFPVLSFNDRMTEARVTLPFTAETDPDALQRGPWPRDLVESRLRERFHVREMTYSLRFVEDRRNPEVNPIFHRHDLQVSGQMDPESFARFLSDIPATVPEAFVYNVATTAWNLVLRIHHPVIVPDLEFTR